MKNVTVKNAAVKTLADRPYIIDFAARKVFVSSVYMKEAGEFGSDAYNQIMTIKADLPDFPIEVIEEKKKAPKKGILTLETMEAYLIKQHGEDSQQVREFRMVREASKAHKAGRFSFMKKWFHAVYPEGYRLLSGIGDAEEKAKQRKEQAQKAVEDALRRVNYENLLRDAESKNNSSENEENSADLEKSAEYSPEPVCI
jgi:hypothetical protein